MKTLRKVVMFGIVAGLSLTATGLFAADQEGKQRRRGGKMPEFLQDLSKEDRAQLKDIMQSMRKEMHTVMKSDAEDKQAKLKAIGESYAPKIKAIVGEDNFKKMQEARQKRMGGKGGKGGMMQNMNLTEDQKTKLKALHEEMQKDREAARAKFEAKVKEIVGEENFKKMQEARKNRGGRGGRRGGRGQRGSRNQESDTE